MTKTKIDFVKETTEQGDVWYFTRVNGRIAVNTHSKDKEEAEAAYNKICTNLANAKEEILKTEEI